MLHLKRTYLRKHVSQDSLIVLSSSMRYSYMQLLCFIYLLDRRFFFFFLFCFVFFQRQPLQILFQFAATGGKCCVAAISSLHVFQNRAVFIQFIFFVICQLFLVSWKIEFRM